MISDHLELLIFVELVEGLRLVNESGILLVLFVQESGSGKGGTHGEDTIAVLGVVALAGDLSSVIFEAHGSLEFIVLHISGLIDLLGSVIDHALCLIHLILRKLIELVLSFSELVSDSLGELLVELGLLGADLSDHAVDDTLDVCGSLFDVFLHHLEGLSVLSLSEFLPGGFLG